MRGCLETVVFGIQSILSAQVLFEEPHASSKVVLHDINKKFAHVLDDRIVLNYEDVFLPLLELSN